MLDLSPPELGFRRPFTHEVSQVLRLHNPSSDPVAFKVKTTAPKQYCVRPNSGRIEPGRDVEVQVLLQAMKEDPPPDTRCRDKFLVQSVAISPENNSGNVTQIWSNIEQTAKSSIQEKKIRVSFLPEDGSAGHDNLSAAGMSTNGLSHHEDEPPAYSSPSPLAVTPQRSAQGPISTPADKPLDAKSRGDAISDAHNPATNPASGQSTLGAAAASIASVIPTSQADLQRSLDTANAQIKRLQEQASEGLRQRKITADGQEKSSVATSMQNAPAPGGVPVQIVAGLCLLCFLVAYLLF
ncbi:phosphatidylinositol-binding protein scs2 [Recurvomyces mirabilis]|nr:phosphatidylinositol-binding protein scs2 [Recurvomyces mirabilis]